jgi:hypothetical protein
VVQLFDTEISRAQGVAAFAARGLAAGETALLVFCPPSSTAIVEHLEALGAAPRTAMAEGRLIVRDAEEMLRSVSRNGVPDRRLFLETVAPAVRRIAPGAKRLWACGEMVDLLAQRGELRSALLLEQLLTELAARIPLMMLCSYSSPHFVSTSTHASLIEICKAHSHVQRDVQDPLGNWLLTAAHNGGGSSVHR